MIVRLCLSLLLPLSLGFIIMNIFLPLYRSSSSYLFLKISFSTGLGLGITSCTYFLFLLMTGLQLKDLIIYEAALLIFLILMVIFFSKSFVASEIHLCCEKKMEDIKMRRFITIGFFCVLILAFTNFINMAIRFPHGGQDGWAIWNMRARFIFRGGAYWGDAFSPLLAPSHHPDYPLLLPLSISRCWSYIGNETCAVPILISLLFTFAVVGILCSSLSVLKSRSQGLLAGLILLGTTTFISFGTFQFADIPLAFFFLASIVFLFLQERSPEKLGLSFLSGTMAGLAGWTKNEGLLFLLVFFTARIMAVFFSQNRKVQMKQLLHFVLGCMPVLAIIIYFKVYLAPPNDVVYGGRHIGEIIMKLGDYSRYVQILKKLLINIFHGIPYVLLLIFYFIYFGIKIDHRGKTSVVTASIVLVLMVMGYYFIYVITPYDLNWHLTFSLTRLLLQLWPVFIFVYFMVVRTPEEVLMNRKFETR